MKTIIIAATALLVTASSASANICVRSRDIYSTDSKDGKLLTVKMKDGRVLVNHLQGICPDLRYDGFVWVLRGGDEDICENMQSLRVLRSGQTCLLGKFDVVKEKTVRTPAGN
ncbi:MAG TPA: hypothetical protein VFI23_13000 [Rhizomicrobium sp.]|nr:hypothetical protein [Rhizomicrobium sp.]